MSEPPTFVHDTKRILHVNEAACHLFRCEEIGLVDVNMLDLISDETLRGLAALRLSSMRELGKTPNYQIKYPFVRCDGTIFWASLSTRLIGDGCFKTTLIYESEA
jgi:PAS domain S-box-containing protein